MLLFSRVELELFRRWSGAQCSQCSQWTRASLRFLMFRDFTRLEP